MLFFSKNFFIFLFFSQIYAIFAAHLRIQTMEFLSSYPLWLVYSVAGVVIFWFIQLLLWLIVWAAPARRGKREKRGKVAFARSAPSVSVVIYAHNQADALLRNLPEFFAQQYPDFEVIVVDDASSDETPDVLKMMEQRNDHFIHTHLDDEMRTLSRRKLAFMLGVKAAHGEIVIATQAQCTPSSEEWIASVVRNFNEGIDFVLAPVAYENRAGFLSRFYSYDLFQRMITLFGLTLAVRPYAGWGTNLAFRKEVFFANHNQGFANHLNIHPGEDDLFVADVSTRSNVTVECSSQALIIDQQSPLSYGWSRERKNRAFTSHWYHRWPMSVRLLDILSRYLFVLGAWALLVFTLLRVDWTSPSLSYVQFILPAVLLLLLLLRATWVISVNLLNARIFRLRRFWLSPLFWELITPVVDFVFKMRAHDSRKTFYVGYIKLPSSSRFRFKRSDFDRPRSSF